MNDPIWKCCTHTTTTTKTSLESTNNIINASQIKGRGGQQTVLNKIEAEIEAYEKQTSTTQERKKKMKKKKKGKKASTGVQNLPSFDSIRFLLSVERFFIVFKRFYTL